MAEFLTKLAEINDSINGFVWVKIGLVLLLGTGIIMTCVTGFFQITHISHWWKKTVGGIFKKESHNKKEHGSVSQFQSLCTALAATIGTGNIAGVASAIVVGGPGAVFWMWIAAFFGMMTNYSENVLGIYYRRRNANGEWSGGPMYYLQDGLGGRKGMKIPGKILAIIFACFAILASFGIGNMGQINKIVINIQSAFFTPAEDAAEQVIPMIADKIPMIPFIIGICLMVIGAVVILGGLKRVAAVAEKVVPFMAIIYIVGAVIIFFLNIGQIGAVISSIFKFALGARAVAGGITGEAIKIAVTQGFKRGVFSNEAGLGSSVMVHSNSDVKEPVMQGLWGIFEVFADTFIVCTMTAVVVLSSGFIDLDTGFPIGDVDDATLVAKAFGNVFGRPGEMFIAVAILLFAFTTVLGWSHYGSKAVEFLGGVKASIVYRVIFVLMIMAGALMTSSLAWDISDTFNGLMMVPNLIGVLALSPLVYKITKNYTARRINKKDVEPILSYDKNIEEEYSYAVMAEQSEQDNSDAGMGVGARLIAQCVVPLLLITIIITAISVKTLTSTIEGERERSLKLVAADVAETYTILYEGDYHQDLSGKLYKGEMSLAGDSALIDAIKAQSGYDVSMVYGTMRVVTTLTKSNGARINGTSIESRINEQIQMGEPVFLKNENVLGAKSYAYYLPLINSDGTVAGCIEAVIPSEDVTNTINAQTRNILLIGFGLLVITTIILVISTSRMSGTMKEIKEFLGQLKAGNLDNKPVQKHLTRKDELGDIYQSSVMLQSTLYSIVDSIKKASDEITDSAKFFKDMADETGKVVDDVSSATIDISGRAKNQADDAQSISENVTSMNNDIEFISKDMNTLVKYADTMAVAEDKSKVILEELNDQSIKTKLALDAVSEQIESMNASIEGIEKAVSLISSIAEETDLLSLNASIEAAKAGDAGRGFAVVAEQIGKLALQSNSSTEEINAVIKTVINDTKKTNEIMREVTKAMELQQKKLEESMAQSRTVSDGVGNSLSGIESMKTKINSLGTSSNEINSSVAALARTSVETDTSATSTTECVQGMLDDMEKLKDSASKLEQLSEQLKITLSVFNI